MMRHSIYLLALFFLFSETILAQNSEDRLRTVNPWIGTGGTFYVSGMNFPGVTTPFGLVRLSPDTQYGFLIFRPLNKVAMATAGYFNSHDKLIGFSHTRLSGTGLKEGGAFRVLPMLRKNMNILKRGHSINHENEKGWPGSYSIDLEDKRLKAELTATTHCGVHRYQSVENLVLNLNPASNLSKHKNLFSQIQINGKEIIGSTYFIGEFSNRYGGHPLYFYAELSQTPTSSYQDQHGLWMNYESDEVKNVELKLCVSVVSALNARDNFRVEVGGLNFDQVQKKSEDEWLSWFDRLKIKTSSEKVTTIFNSALYRSAIMPTTFQDQNGDYLGFGNKVSNTQEFTYVTDLSLWDTFRTIHPLYTLIAPEWQYSSLRSLIEMSRSSNQTFPLWPQGSGDGASMFGHPAHFIFAESWAKGIRGFDPDEVVNFMKNEALDPTSPCVELGFCPVNEVNLSVSNTLERAWANGVTARFAKSINHPSADDFYERSLDYKNIWDPHKKFFAPKTRDGQLLKYAPKLMSYLDIFKINHNAYAEGSPHHWRYSAPHEIKDLIERFGGKEVFVQKLETFMDKSSLLRSSAYPGAYYWQGNEHNLHAIFLFNEAGRPDLTQKWTRWALRTRYGTGPAGLDGNDDGGTLSAWYVLAAIGLYPQAGTEHYWITSPYVDEAELDMGLGRKLLIKTKNNPQNNYYIKSLTLNGKPVCGHSLTHQDLYNSVLEFEMTNLPVVNRCE
jgi:predicted alpha-1,2-mannosidase